MNYTGNEEHAISLADAAELTARYRAQFNAETFYIKGEYFGKNALNSLLNQVGCVGARMYYGLKADQSQCLVIVGVDSSGNDITTGEIMDFGIPCPNACSVDNALNC